MSKRKHTKLCGFVSEDGKNFDLPKGWRAGGTEALVHRVREENDYPKGKLSPRYTRLTHRGGK